jgi:hypothetical protein
MYSETDLASAVEAGVLSPAAVAAFRNHVASGRATPAVDEESFRLLTGFNDIFVGIAATLILVAVGWIGFYLGSGGGRSLNSASEVGTAVAVAGFAVSGTSWLLAEYFTRKRRMALPSILLLIGFAGGFFAGAGAVFGANAEAIANGFGVTSDVGRQQIGGVGVLLAGLVTAGAAWLHWRRFMVPITVAVGALALVAMLVGALVALVPASRDAINPMLLVAGAFWLHLAAAPLIAHPVFHMLGVFAGDMAAPMAAVVIALYLAFAAVALAVDRRALLVSSLVYVLWAMYALLQQTGAMELAAGLTALLIGAALLTLSAFWQPMRRQVVGLLGSLADRLPPTQQLAHA